MLRVTFNVFVGWDPKDAVAYHTLCHSILTRATVPLSITPLVKNQLTMYRRPRGPTESTEFSLTRFLVPYLSKYEGYSLFMDPDMLCLVDLDSLWEYIQRDFDNAVWVCKHEYAPRAGPKMDGIQQTSYPRKNWSSFMVFDNYRCRTLTPTYVNQASGLELHRFDWLQDKEIGSLPLDWNYLVGEYPHNSQAKILHYTRGGPWMPGFQDSDHALEWLAERNRMLGIPEEAHG